MTAAEDVAGWFRAQSTACAAMGSPLWAGVLQRAAADVGTSGPLGRMLEPFERWRFGDALPLRVLGAAHHLALAGRCAPLAGRLPSCGGQSHDADALFELVLDALEGAPDVLSDYLARAVQTNEVARAAGLICGLADLSRTGRDIDLIEIGPSAGLNLRMDHFAYEVAGEVVVGNPRSGVRIADVWDRPLQPAEIRVQGRVGVDPNPMDTSRPDVRDRLRAYVWPDQATRLARLDAALALAADVPATLEQSHDTPAWLAERLGDRPAGTMTVVYHSIVWQYIDPATRTATTQAIETAGAHADEARPLARLTYEPDEFSRDRAAVFLRTWPGGAGRLLAHADYHGRWVKLVPG